MNNNDNGFTLIELVVVILVIAILAISTLPNLDSSDKYSITTDRDQLISLLRSVQTRAMQNTIDSDCYGVYFSNTNIGMVAQDESGNCTTELLVQSDDLRGFLTLSPENSYKTTDEIAFIQFDDFGRPLNSVGESTGRFEVEFAGATSVCVESEGYIHVCD